METLGGTLYGVVVILALFLAILALLMPWFVYQIRNQTKDMDRKMDTIIGLLGGQKQIKVCPSCGAKNRAQDFKCLQCGKPLPQVSGVRKNYP